MKNAPINPLSAEFLYELYAAALRYDTLCGVVAENMCKEYLPDRSFQKIQEVIANHYRTYKSPPTYATLSQTFQGDYDAIELLETFREYEEENTNTESLTDMLEGYIKSVRLQKVYTEVGKLYNQNRPDKAETLLAEYAGWLSSFTLRTTAFVDVAKTFRERFEHNRRREAESRENRLPQVCRFYIPYLDALNGGRNLRGQLTCFLASTGGGQITPCQAHRYPCRHR